MTLDLLARYRPWLRYDSHESYFTDSPAIMTDAYVPGVRSNSLKRAAGTILASADPDRGPAPLGLDQLDGARYASGAAVRRDDLLDAAGHDYVADARRMHAIEGYADRVCAHLATDAAGKRWLQYWFFAYYNDKGFLGFGLHEGDWEMTQVALDDSDDPDQVTLAQHGGGERCLWADLETHATAQGPAPVIYVARGSHASHIHKGSYDAPVVPDHNDAGGPLVRPDLIEIDDGFPSWAAWPGYWGSTRKRLDFESDSPRGPSQHPAWSDPAGFHAHATPSPTVAAHARAIRSALAPAAPTISAERVGDRALVSYTFPNPSRNQSAPARLLITLDAVDDQLPPASYTFDVAGREGAEEHPLELGAGAYRVRATAYDDQGHASPAAQTTLPPA